MDKKVCILTGANAGIGKAAAELLGLNGFHVIMVCRDKKRGEDALTKIKQSNPSISLELMIADMGNMESVKKLSEEFRKKYTVLDVLIHNAAIFNVTQKNAVHTAEGIETVWATNHLGPVLLTSLLLDNLKQSDNGRVITISSKGLLAKPLLKVDLKDPEYKSKKFNIVNAYYQSKLAQMIYTNWLSKKLKDSSVTSNCIRVPAVQIDVSRHPELSSFMKWVYSQKSKNSITPQEMAKTYLFLAQESNLSKITGEYFTEKNRVVDQGKYTKDNETIKKVMELTNSYLEKYGVL